MKDDVLKNAFQGWDILSATQEEVLAYEARLKQVLDEGAAKREAELREQEAVERGLKEGLEKGLEQGLKKGLEKGLEKGLQKGLKKGRTEGHQQGVSEEKKATAKRMLQEGLDIELITKLTELTKGQVQAFKEEMEK